MGHRALVADARSNRGDAATDGFTVWYSHWGAHAFALIDALSDPSNSPGPRRSKSGRPPQSDPLGTASEVDAFAAEFVDPTMNEAAFVVSADDAVTAYLPLTAAVGPGSPNAGGVLVELHEDPHPAVDARAIRSWARENRLDGRPVARPGSPTTPAVVLDRFHDAVTTAFPDRNLHRIPPAKGCSRPRPRGSRRPGD